MEKGIQGWKQMVNHEKVLEYEREECGVEAKDTVASSHNCQGCVALGTQPAIQQMTFT